MEELTNSSSGEDSRDVKGPTVPQNAEAPVARHMALPTVLAVLFVIALAMANRMPDTVRTFVALSIIAGALVLGGFVTLILLIPATRPNPDVKTEFLSARAAYLCVIAGLILFGIITVGAVFARVMLNVGRH